MSERSDPYPGTPPYLRDAEDVLAELGTDARAGLTDAEARARLARYGPNRLTESRATPAWQRFFAQFADVLVILLLVAVAISAVLWLVERDAALPYEAVAIFAIVLLNAFMGYVQQARAEHSLAALRDMSASTANVLRGGERRSIPATGLVPGDIVLIEEGDTIPADGRLIQSTSLAVSEAALTGESHAVRKDTAPLEAETVLGDRRNMIFSGTTATYGRGRAVVTATGMQTEMGRIAGLLKETPQEQTPLQAELDRVGKLLGAIVVVIAVVMIATIFLVSDVDGVSAVFDVLILGVALAVAAVPEGLPAIVTAVLSIGVERMARRNAIVRRLAAVETLGSADVIASDKTGTLTRNEMTARAIVTASGRVELSGTGYAPEGDVTRADGAAVTGPLCAEVTRALIVADRANNATLACAEDGTWAVQGDPTEGALLVAARKAGFDADALDARHPRLAEIPFSSERKLMSTLHGCDPRGNAGCGPKRYDGGNADDVHSAADPDRERDDRGRADDECGAVDNEVVVVMTKGAPDVLVGRCTSELVGDDTRPLTDARRAEILDANEELAAEALRTLGLAFREVSGKSIDQERVPDDVEHELVFIGLIGMIDPPRAEAQAAVARAKRAGIRSIMITGDHPRTAAVIARELGIADGHRAVTGAELEKMTDDELDALVQDVSVYARVDPEHKLRIVGALQRLGLTVAMTGDGVNDAPALKAADIGVAMGITGTDVSKQAGDMVLADDNFATIVAAVEEGRAIFANIRKFLRYLLSSNVGEVMTMFFGVLFADALGLTQAATGGALVLPLLATQILWVNLVTDGAPALALGLDPPDERTMSRPPRPRGEGVLTPRMWRGIFGVGAIFALGTLLVLDASLPGGFVEGNGDLRHGQTMAFNTIVLLSLFNVFNARSDERSAFRGLGSNAWLWAAVLLSVVLQIAVIYVPFLQNAFSTAALDFGDWLLCTVVASAVLWLRELWKLVVRLSARRGTKRSGVGDG